MTPEQIALVEKSEFGIVDKYSITKRPISEIKRQKQSIKTTVMVLSFGQPRLYKQYRPKPVFLEELSDEGVHCFLITIRSYI